MRVAVVIPTKNGSQFIEETVRGVVQQTRPPDEVVIVDDSSTDDTVARIAGVDPSLVVIPNGGVGANRARATAVAATRSELLAFLDHDDVWYPDHLEIMVRLLERFPHAAMAYSRLQQFSAQVPIPVLTDEIPQVIDLWKTFPHNRVGGPSSVVVRRSALEQIGGWPTWNRIPTDVYLWFRLADAGPFVWWPAPTAAQRVHPASMSHTAMRADVVGYARGRLDLLGEALEIHVGQNPGVSPLLHDRLGQLTNLVDLLGAVVTGDVGEIEASAELIEQHELPNHMAGYFRQALSGAIDGRPDGPRTALAWLLDWPDSHRDLRALLVEPVVVKALVSGVRARPSRPLEWGIPATMELRHAARPVLSRMVSTGARRTHGVGHRMVGAIRAALRKSADRRKRSRGV